MRKSTRAHTPQPIFHGGSLALKALLCPMATRGALENFKSNFGANRAREPTRFLG